MDNSKIHLNPHELENNEESIRNLAFEEDEYGYLAPKTNRASLISQLPSRHLDTFLEDETEGRLSRKNSRYRTLQLRNATLNTLHKPIDAEKIYEILSHVDEEEKMKTLREMHQSLTIKRQVKEKLDADRKKKIASRALGTFVRWKLGVSMMFQRLAYEVKNVFSLMEPWQSSIKSVQGQYGSCVASYFIFLRWLLYLNLINFLVTFCFVFVPQIIYQSPSNSGNTTFMVQDILTGSGWFMSSHLYFGAYSSENIGSYKMPLAYMSSIFANMFIALIALSVSITSTYQKNYVDTAGEIKNVFCNKIFSAWDYGIETETAAHLQRQAVCNDIKELLYTKRLSERRMTLFQTILQRVSTLLVTLFSLAIVAAVGYLTYYLLENKSVKVDIPILEHMTFALTVTIISSVFFYLLKYSTIFEAYLSKKMRLYLTMIRVIVLRTVMLGIVTYFWMVIYKPPRDKKICYENELGSEFYRLILVNFLVAVVIFTLISEYLRKLIHKYISPHVSLKEFDVAYNTLDLVYFQTLAWLAMYCVPLISLILVIILILLFYIKLSSMSWNCRPPKRSWSVNETQTFYFVLTFCMLFFSAITVAYTIFGLETSYCGPFQDYDFAGNVIQEIFSQHLVSLRYIASPGILFALFCALCLAVHYMRAQATAHTQVIKKIRETLILASKDKVFLLKLFDEAVSAHINNLPHNKSSRSNFEEEGKKGFKTFDSPAYMRRGSAPHQTGFRHVMPS